MKKTTLVLIFSTLFSAVSPVFPNISAPDNVLIHQSESPVDYPDHTIFILNSEIMPITPPETTLETSYSISPELPSGLELDSQTGIISGTPTAISPATTYTITATDVNGSINYEITITVNSTVFAPDDLSYASPVSFMVGVAIPELSATVTGTVDSYAVSPALPTGLSIDATTGVISGTPTSVTPTAVYVVTATNSGGNVTFDLTITINDAAPTNLSYPTPNVFVIGTVITPLSPAVTGNVTSYAISPVLAAGLVFNTETGVISGTPTVVSPTANYTVTATNSGGSVEFELSITVSQPAPTVLSYTSPNMYTVGTTISPLFPAVVGFITGFTVSPDLPDGLSLNPIFGMITGTPTTATPTATYTVTAFNLSGSVSFGVVITVNEIAPTDLSYPTPNVFTVGNTIVALSPTLTGNATSFGISPALPAGLVFNTETGVISGTPTAVSATATYTVTATNPGGSTTFGIAITINEPAPSALSYPSPNTFVVGTAIAALTPTVSGNVSSYTISPSLPTGLSFNTATGVISGIPTVASVVNTYTVTATNSGGSVSFEVVITVNQPAPTVLSYTSPNMYTVGTTISPLFPAVVGFITGFTVSPDLPDGLSLNPIFGMITGTPTTATPTATYTVTASNPSGSISFGIVITVNPVAPSALSYTTPNVLTVGSAITALHPNVSGNVASYSVSPTLPAGLSINASTGIISGTPTAVTAAATYIVTATNPGGSTTFSLVITVNDVAPFALSYSSPNTFTVGVSIVALSPSVTGSVNSYSVSPTLPAGLSIDASTGILSGTPTFVTATGTYTVTAANSGGSTAFGLVITVNDVAPFALSYTSPNVFTVNSEITPLTPTVIGTTTAFSISPTLPAGLSFDAATGTISGTPTLETATATYTITASNSGGSATFGILITVNPELGLAQPKLLQFTVYPNPFDDSVSIKGLEGNATYLLYSVDGKLVASGNVIGDKMDFGLLQQGLYTLIIESGGTRGIQKLIRK